MQSGIPWDDASGKRLRGWLDVDADTFYDETRLAIVPMGFCYPGRGASGDNPPRPECAPLWIDRLLAELPSIRLTLLIGQYAQRHFPARVAQATLTDTVHTWRDYGPGCYRCRIRRRATRRGSSTTRGSTPRSCPNCGAESRRWSPDKRAPLPCRDASRHPVIRIESSMNDTPTDLDFACNGCGGCCRDLRIPLTIGEAIAWLQRGGHVELLCDAMPWLVGPERQRVRRVQARVRSSAALSGSLPVRITVMLTATHAGPCPNLGDDMRCAIYDARPLVCRIYPAEVNPFVPLVPDGKQCTPDAWQQAPFVRGGTIVDADTRENIARSRAARASGNTAAGAVVRDAGDRYGGGGQRRVRRPCAAGCRAARRADG